MNLEELTIFIIFTTFHIDSWFAINIFLNVFTFSDLFYTKYSAANT